MASFSSENEVGKRSSHRAAKQSRFHYNNTTVIAGGAAIELRITKLPMYHRPEGIKHKKQRAEQIPHARSFAEKLNRMRYDGTFSAKDQEV